MAQTTILASGTTAATSTDIVVAAGASVTVGIFSASGAYLSSALEIAQKTPSADIAVGQLDSQYRSVIIDGPGTFKVKRPVLATAFGVFLDA